MLYGLSLHVVSFYFLYSFLEGAFKQNAGYNERSEYRIKLHDEKLMSERLGKGHEELLKLGVERSCEQLNFVDKQKDTLSVYRLDLILFFAGASFMLIRYITNSHAETAFFRVVGAAISEKAKGLPIM